MFPRVLEVGALSARLSGRQEKVVRLSPPSLKNLPKIKGNISSLLSKCLPSFDLAGRPLSFPSPTPPLILRGSAVHVVVK